jgi:hypothetical protein
VRIVSNDGKEFIMSRDIAFQCKQLKIMIQRYRGPEDIPKITMENVNGRVLEIIVQYMHHKCYWK